MTETKNKHIGKILIGLALIVSLFAGFYFYSKPSIEIKDFDEKRDLPFIKNAFDTDYYWLVANPEFSLDFLLKHKSPNRNPEYFGKLNFKILFENGKPAGFTTYFKEKFYQGKIQFIYVNPNFRNKGYAKKLATYAAKDLFEKGVSIVVILTRQTNTAAIKAYKSIGFKVVYEDKEFVDFEATKDQIK